MATSAIMKQKAQPGAMVDVHDDISMMSSLWSLSFHVNFHTLARSFSECIEIADRPLLTVTSRSFRGIGNEGREACTP